MVLYNNGSTSGAPSNLDNWTPACNGVLRFAPIMLAFVEYFGDTLFEWGEEYYH
jgi:hypothetical protein